MAKEENTSGEYPDPTKPYNDEDIRWLHDWGLDYKIAENQRRFAQSDKHDEGQPVDLKAALDDAGVVVPPLPVNPAFVVVGTELQPVQPQVQVPSPEEDFDEEATRAELESWHVPELKKEAKERGLDDDGLKAELIDRIVEDLKGGE